MNDIVAPGIGIMDGYQAFPEGSGITQYTKGFEILVGPMWHKQCPDNRWLFKFQVAEHHMNPAKSLHGGMLSTFADHVLGGTAFHAVGQKPCITVSLHTDFVATARLGDWIEGSADVSRVTGNLVFVSGRIFVGEKTILTASGVWRIF